MINALVLPHISPYMQAKLLFSTFGPSGPGAPGIPLGPCRPVAPSSPLSPGIPRSPWGSRRVRVSLRSQPTWNFWARECHLPWVQFVPQPRALQEYPETEQCRHSKHLALHKTILIIHKCASFKANSDWSSIYIVAFVALTTSPGFPGSPGGPWFPGKP